eukprot:m.35862 g.35862  ORF g.35862 m.35862 type:complete len:64 (-) comp17217_c0_seq1:83-274(-)
MNSTDSINQPITTSTETTSPINNVFVGKIVPAFIQQLVHPSHDHQEPISRTTDSTMNNCFQLF